MRRVRKQDTLFCFLLLGICECCCMLLMLLPAQGCRKRSLDFIIVWQTGSCNASRLHRSIATTTVLAAVVVAAVAAHTVVVDCCCCSSSCCCSICAVVMVLNGGNSSLSTKNNICRGAGHCCFLFLSSLCLLVFAIASSTAMGDLISLSSSFLFPFSSCSQHHHHCNHCH